MEPASRTLSQAMDRNTLSEGQIFAHRYTISKCVAAGGMGAVYEARHTETERRVALKVMLPHFVSNADLRDRFKREAKITANIGSEFIVEVLDAGVDEETEMPFLVMEYLEGTDLAGEVESKGPLDPELAVTYLHQAAMALQRTHAASIVHRDLKPENLFLTKRDDGSPRVKILDFGISKVIESARTNATQTLGTPLYMAPEQFGGKVSPSCDIYALGMIAYTLLVGVAYWTPDDAEDDSVFALAGRVMGGVTEPASEHASRRGVTLPPGFDAWFAKACHRDPKERFTGAVELVNALAEACGVPSPARGRLSSLPGDTGRQQVDRPTPAATNMALAADASSTGPARAPKRMLPVAIGGGVLAVAAIAAVVVLGTRKDPPAGGLAQPEPSVTVPATTVSAPAVTTPAAVAVQPPEAQPSASVAAPSTAAPTPARKEPAQPRDKKNAKAEPTGKATETPATPPAQPQPQTTGGVYSRF